MTMPDPPQPTDDELVAEMQALIRIASYPCVTPTIKQATKIKLKQLSQIPLHNEWGDQTIRNYGK